MGEYISIVFLTAVIAIVLFIHAIRNICTKFYEYTCMDCHYRARCVRMKYCNHITLCVPCGRKFVMRPIEQRVCHECATPVFYVARMTCPRT